MQDISTNTHTVIKDSRGRISLVIADTLSDVAIGEPIPEGTLGWDKNTGQLSRYTSGAWSVYLGGTVGNSLGYIDEFGVFRGTSAQVTGGYITSDTAMSTPVLDIFGNGAASYFSFGLVEETFTLAGDGTMVGTASIPDNAYILAAKVAVTTILAGDNVATFDIGLSVFNTADADALTPTQISTVTTGVKQRQMFKFDAIGPTASDKITLSAFEVDGSTPCDPESGVVVVTILYVRTV